MRQKFLSLGLIWMVLVPMLAACGGGTTAATTSATSQSATSVISADTTTSTATVVVPTSVTEAASANGQTHAVASDYTWDAATAVQILLNGDSITTSGAGVTVSGRSATITAAGSYVLSGTLSDGQIIVDTKDNATVQLILQSVTLQNSTSSPLYVANAEKVVLIVAEGTQNQIADGSAYVFASADEDEPNAAIFSKANLTIAGTGALTVTGNYQDAIVSKDGLIIAEATLSVTAKDDGIRGKDYLVVKSGNLTVNAGGDGLKSDNADDATLGYISIEQGQIVVTVGGDALTAATDVLIASGDLTLTAGGGSSATLAADQSAKGIKAGAEIVIDGGSFHLDTADDALHSNSSIAVHGGAFSIKSGDDGMHADAALTITNGDVQVLTSYEGLESAQITIDAGTISLITSDDGINVSAGNDSSGMGGGPGMGGRPGGDSFASNSSNLLTINGGTVLVDSLGDGLDANGSISITGGTVIVNGPTENMNSALDCDGSFNVSGGLLVAVGSSGMAEAPDDSSSQYALMINSDTVQAAGTLIHIESSAGQEILTFAPTRQYQSVVVSSPDLINGETYEISYGGTASGEAQSGLYPAGSYTSGTAYARVTISGMVTRVGNSGGQFHP